MRNIGELSGGEFQLVRIARCLAQGASILILDEPASMLDPAHSRHIADVLASLADSGITIIYTTHDIELGLFLGGEALILSGGMIQWSGPAEGLHNTEILTRTYGISFQTKRYRVHFEAYGAAMLDIMMNRIYKPVRTQGQDHSAFCVSRYRIQSGSRAPRLSHRRGSSTV